MSIEKLDVNSQISIEIMQVFNQIPFNRMLGLNIEKIESDHIVASFPMQKELVGNFHYGILHGGVISSVLDVAGGVAAMIAATKKHSQRNIIELANILAKTGTINLNINFLNPGKGEHFTAKAWVQKIGSKVIFTRMELHNEEIIIASGIGTYRVG